MGPLNPENSSKQDLDDSGYVQDGSATENVSKGYPQLLDLSDDVLLYILQYLTPRDLKALGHTCPRLGTLICDRTLWTRVDHRNSPVGEHRLRWLLTHCLCPATIELKLAGYANKYSRCLGIQDIPWPEEANQDYSCMAQDGGMDGVDVEHFLLRMWYPHHPRYTASPRWPDEAEIAIKESKAEAENKKAAEEAAFRAAEAAAKLGFGPPRSRSSASSSSSSGKKSSTSEHDYSKLDKFQGSSSDPQAGCSRPNSGKSDQFSASSSSDQESGGSRPNSGKSDQNGSCTSRNSTTSDQNSSFICQNPSNSSHYSRSAEARRERDAFLLQGDNCKGPHFSLTTNLMKDLRKTCPHLTSLALEYCNLDYKVTNLRHFPMHLRKLSLRGTRCYNLPINISFLGKVQQRLPDLEILDVSECDWFEPASLMPLSKLPALTELHMRDCRRLTECVAYASLSTRYGFKKLRVFDARGCPLADSEVSALGWLPALEELYMSPPDEFGGVAEHTHMWVDTKTVFTELDSWETEEPEYYKVKSPDPEQEDEDQADETDNERQADVIINNPWWAHERRIIVIQPNARHELEQQFPLRPGQAGNEEDENWQAQARQAPRERQPDPQPGPADPQPGPVNPQPGPANPPPGPANPRRGRSYPLPFNLGSIDVVPINPPRPMQDVLDEVLLRPNARPVPFEPRQGPTDRPGPANPENPQPGPSNQVSGPSNQVPGPSNEETGPSNPQPGPSNPQPGPANPQAGPANAQPGPSNPQAGPSNAQPRPENPGDGNPKRRLTVAEAMDLGKRRRLAEEEEGVQVVGVFADPAHFPAFNPGFCRRFRAEEADGPENEREQPRQAGLVRFRRHDQRHIMHIDLDIHRHSNVHMGTHVGYQLVTDSSLLRFGRAENENVNYIHIGRNGVHHGSETGSRPDRANLRILSVTGYRNITDRSLQHLVTAAPYLVHVDFTETNVTARGVELFKAVKPDCDVVFSQFGRMM